MKRRILTPIVATAALVLTACSGSADGSSVEAEPVNDQVTTLSHPTIDGLEISFEQQPESLVMDCYAYSSLYEYGLEPDALFGYDCENPWVMGDADISGIEKIGQDGEINMEKLAELRPDAIIGQGDEDGWAWFDEDVNAQLMQVANFIPLPSGESVDENIDDTREVANFLGADTESAEIAQSDADYETAKQEFAEAAEGKDLSFMFASPTKEMLYTAVGFNQANLLEELGVTIVGPSAPESGSSWGSVAWEEASTYPADVILAESYDSENGFTTELWDNLPAIEAGQISGWSSKGAMTSRAYADWLSELAGQVESYDKVV
ncbi:ABC transporter substrate-binding protein [Corynebacterium alimapuense]|uniref:ABC transporter substrate-binding protein n=1 Tax=Corynebacterium alimapuense TaxID=1576874 RepID=A0A3M8KBN6_9CORY|nr:ABC transporter substrate-binding protein [Corynebacterium alimapuense]RNE49798.1 ABC transporter substrate-binding protein [Corynebacterium alimapuense]